MIYFTLPEFYENFMLNNFFIKLLRERPELFKTKLNIIQTSGNFPYCCWNGAHNSNHGIGAYYNDYSTCSLKNGVPLRLNCANVLLETTDFNDAMGNVILDLCHNGSNLIEISNLDFMEKIIEKYPNYKFVFSKYAHLMTEFTPDLLNDIIGFQKFNLIGIPESFNKNFDFLTNINQKKYLELTVNPICPLKCKQLFDCEMNEQKGQLCYSCISLYNQCKKVTKFNIHNPAFISIEEIQKIYLPMGITHFTFSSGVINDNYTMFNFYTHYFIKPEFHQLVLDLWEQGASQNK